MMHDDIEVISVEWGNESNDVIVFNVIEYGEYEYKYFISDADYCEANQNYYKDAINGVYGDISPYKHESGMADLLDYSM